MSSVPSGSSCAACGHANRAGRRFCSECGAPLAVACPACGGRNEAGERFCGECGALLAPGAARSASGSAASSSGAVSQPSLGPPARPAAPTSLAAGRYQLDRFLGEGAKKLVFLARDTRLRREVAIALVKTEGLDAAGLARVRREAEAMGQLGDHPNVVTIFDVAEEGGQVYIVSRYMPGGDVDGLLREAESRRLAIPQALRIATDVARALDHSHSRGIVHRDVKPGNVWLAEDGTAQLGDFGLAVLVDRSRLTQEGMMVGTVAYMPPEQALGRTPDARSDLYGLGAMLYEMLAGRPPFQGDDAVSVIAQHINTPPVKPSWHNDRVSAELDALVLRLLAKDPDERPKDAGEVAAALRALLDHGAGERTSSEVAAAPAALLPESAGRFVGRQSELAQLQAALARTLGGDGGVVMVVGEPGIGKTRLTDEFAVHAKLRGAQVFKGHCYEGEASVPYLPFVEGLRHYAQSRPDAQLRAELGEAAPELATLVSEVRRRFPDLPAPPALEGEAERQRLFDGVASFLHGASIAAPLVLVLDDLHWADKPTLLLLQYLARRIRRDRVLLVGTYRDVELERTHPLADTIASLRRDGLYERVLLRGLDLHGVRDLIREAGGQDPPDRFVERILRETEGNPFFVAEVLKHLIETGALRREKGEWVGDPDSVERSIPEGVREVIGRRLSRLSERCNALLSVASAMPGGFSFEVLSALSDEGEDRVLEQLEEALRAQLVRERQDGSGSYEFGHALIRQTLYHELSTPRRVRLHRQIGEALERLYGRDSEPHLAELAHHFFQGAPGGDIERAVDACTRAAARARELLAWEETAAHLGRALEADEMRPVRDERRRFELLASLGEAQRLSGERAASRRTFQRAVELARRLADVELLARAALGYATEDVIVEFDEPATLELLEEALAALGPVESPLRARLLSRLALGRIFDADVSRRDALASEAVALARRLGEPGLLGRVLVMWALLDPVVRSGEEHAEQAREIVRCAEAARLPALALDAAMGLIRAHLDAGDVAALDREIEASARAANELRLRPAIFTAALQRAMRALLCGPFDEAERRIEEARAAGERAEHPLCRFWYLVQRSALLAEIGGVLEANRDLEQFLKTTRAPVGPTPRLSTALRMGRMDEVRALLAETARDDFAAIPHDINWLGRMVLVAVACAALDDRERAAAVYDGLLPHRAAVAVGGPAAACLGPVSHHLAQLAALLGRWEDAERHFAAALEHCEKLEARPVAAHVRCDWAAMLAARLAPGDRERALSLANAALAGAQQLGMKPLVEQALALKLELQGVPSGELDRSIYAVASRVETERPDLHAHAAPDGTVTLLFSDMEGFSAMTERLGDLRAREVIRRHNRIVRQQLAAHGGYEVELQGDGFLLAFGSARQGLHCAIGIQRALDADAGAHADEPIRVRIGVHTGEALRDADKFFGKTVILSARIAAQAAGGEILVSSLVRELVASAGDVRFGAARDVELKGLSEPQRVHPVEWR
jgi:class 3 adenylate cyclase